MRPNWYLNYNCPFYYRDISNDRGRYRMQNVPMHNVPQPQQPQQPQQPKPQQLTPTPPSFEIAPGSPTALGVGYTQEYLRRQIGKRVKVTFLLGTNTIQDRDGILVEVGISYLVLKDLLANYLTMADLYSVKFVNIYEE